MSYATLLDKVYRELRTSSNMSMWWERDVIEHEDFDIPGALAVSPTGRVMLIIEGDKEHVYPVIEKAQEVLDGLRVAS
jgi:hypothetical protein